MRSLPSTSHQACSHSLSRGDEAAVFIAETVADLARLAHRHRLEILGFLLRMAQLEAEERVRLRSKRKLS